MTELIVCRGLPASGKTTWAREWVAEDVTGRARVNKDDLRRLLHDGRYEGSATEDTVNLMRNTMIETLLQNDISVVNDDTNLPSKVAREIWRIGKKAGATVTVKSFGVSLEEAIYRDARRGILSIGWEPILRMHTKYVRGREWPLPEPDDPVDAETIFRRYTPDESLPGAWLVDMDGTLALMNGRAAYDYTRVNEDLPNPSVIQAVKALRDRGYKIIVMSGREITCEDDTVKWLHRYEVPFNTIIMRASGDHRKDSIVKHELFWAKVAPHYHVLGSLDDRNQVVDMWREIGLTCLQVAPGDF